MLNGEVDTTQAKKPQQSILQVAALDQTAGGFHGAVLLDHPSPDRWVVSKRPALRDGTLTGESELLLVVGHGCSQAPKTDCVMQMGPVRRLLTSGQQVLGRIIYV